MVTLLYSLKTTFSLQMFTQCRHFSAIIFAFCSVCCSKWAELANRSRNFLLASARDFYVSRCEWLVDSRRNKCVRRVSGLKPVLVSHDNNPQQMCTGNSSRKLTKQWEVRQRIRTAVILTPVTIITFTPSPSCWHNHNHTATKTHLLKHYFGSIWLLNHILFSFALPLWQFS